MKKYWRNIGIIVGLFVVWRLVLNASYALAPNLWPAIDTFFGPVFWANFDGVHYLSIVQFGYRQYQQAFFPFYPLVVRGISSFFSIAPDNAAQAVSILSTFGGLFVFYRLAKLEKISRPLWPVLFLLAFPVSFFFSAAYTTGLYFLLACLSLLAMKEKRWLLTGIFGALASATQVFGVFLLLAAALEYMKEKEKKIISAAGLALIPLGLLGFMAYLWKSVGDPLAFYHTQPLFGAQRSGSEIILLPQVLWRYLHIASTFAVDSYVYWIALFELAMLGLAVFLLWFGYKRNISKSLLAYSLAVVLLPTLTGTLSSFPRYVLSAFPLFLVLGDRKLTVRKILLSIFFLFGLVLFTTLFLRGHFVS